MLQMNRAQLIFYTKDSGEISITCDIAESIFEKMKGLMNVTNLPEDRGMLFQFLIPWPRIFWMKNVKIPLDMIFVNKKFKIMNIYEAPVASGFFYKNYWSKGFCKYVIECNKGFCKRNKIKSGDKISIEENKEKKKNCE